MLASWYLKRSPCCMEHLCHLLAICMRVEHALWSAARGCLGTPWWRVAACGSSRLWQLTLVAAHLCGRAHA
jgi:hypothetical protein